MTNESSELEYVSKCKLDGNPFHHLEVFAQPEVEAADVKRPRLPMTPLQADIRLPTAGENEIEIWPHSPVCVYAEMVELNLSDRRQRNLAQMYAFRNRCCFYEGIMNPLLNDVEMLEGFQEDGEDNAC